MNSLALVINSHSSNQDCLRLFFIQLEKYFEEQTFSNVYLFVDKIAEDFNLPTYVTIVPYEDEDSFTDQMIQCLSAIDENVILYCNEDYLFYDSPDNNSIKNLASDLEHTLDLSYIRFVYADIESFATYTELHGKSLLYIPSTSQCCYSQTLSLWKTSDYLKIHEHGPKASIGSKGEAQGHFEILARSTCRDLNIQGCVINDNKNKRGLFHYDSNIVPHVASALVKGRWNLSEYPELVDILSENKIDYNLRGSV